MQSKNDKQKKWNQNRSHSITLPESATQCQKTTTI